VMIPASCDRAVAATESSKTAAPIDNRRACLTRLWIIVPPCRAHSKWAD